MTKHRVRVSVPRMLACAVILAAHSAVGGQPVIYQTPKDVPLCLAPVREPSQSDLMVGYASGRLIRLQFVEGRPRVAWEAKVDGGILAILELSQAREAGRDVIASTATGRVVCFRGDTAEPAWRFESTCEVSCMAELPDVDGDGAVEVVVGGADHRAHLLSGKTGKEIWQRLLESPEGSGYVMGLLVGADQDQDAIPDVAVWLWSGELAVLSGRSGGVIWQKRIGGEYTGALAAIRDVDGDAFGDLLLGGNDGVARVCSGRDGTILWSGRVDRPIRDLTATSAKTAQEAAVYVCTAGGEVARFDVHRQDAADKPRWTTNLGDVCRGVIVTTDVDRDGTPDAAACAENGVVAILSGKTGRVLRRWRAADTVRAICPVRNGDQSYLAIADLDATVRLLPADTGDPTADTPETPAAKPPRSQAHAPQNDRRRPGSEKLPAGSAGASNAPRILVLLYHDVLPEAIYHYATSVKTFRAHMDMLVREKYTCVSLDQIADWMEGKGGMPDRAVCITFDGQYQGQYTYAFPILRERKLFATSYITTDWIGTPNHSDWDQLREMEAAGVMDVQNHTINHPFLTRCDRSEVIRQLAICNEAIERHMNGKLARHHTYPSGANNEQVRQIVREQGFRTATTVRSGPVTRKDDLMGVPRYMLCVHKTLEDFRGCLSNVNTIPVDRAGRTGR